MRMVLVFVAVAAVTVACRGNVFSLEVGDCFNNPKDGLYEDEVEDVDIVECSESHDNEVYAIAEYPADDDAPYPPIHSIVSFAEEACGEEFEDYVGAQFEDSRFDVSYLHPLPDGWELLDDRGITCFLYDASVVKLVGSQKGSGR